jgi:hypothetical protein
MKCVKILPILSAYLDEELEEDRSLQVADHLEGCTACRAEFGRLTRLRQKLASLEKIEAPEYLHRLVHLRLEKARQETWRALFRQELEYRWSIIRTTEGLWYLTRLLGSAATFVLFCAIVAAVQPVYVDRPDGDRSALRQQLPQMLMKNLGMSRMDAQRKPIPPSDPQINDLYLLNFSQNASRATHDDSISVVTKIDRTGTAQVQDVLEYSSDNALLSDFRDMIQTARFRPASHNGRAVDSHLVLTFSRISVYD